MTAYRTIIVDTDGSDRSYRVVDHAAELAHATHARLLIICAATPSTHV
ncbi:universal stress protein, partial [Rhodococcus hoagii]|nr:universal stress protein [Prescottella equi]